MSTDLDLRPEDFSDTARAVMEACAKEDSLAARSVLLAEAGLTGILASEDAGGMGLPLNFAVPVLAAAGEGFLGAPLLEAMLLARAFSGADDDTASAIASGELKVTIAWNGALDGTSGTVGRAPMATECDAVLVFRADGTATLVTLGQGAEAENTDTLDVDRPEALVRVSEAKGPELSAEAVTELRRSGHILAAALILGAAEDSLDRACTHAQEREQFGKPLAANQAIQHHLARACLSVETIRNSIQRCLSPVCETPEAAARATCIGAASHGAKVAETAIQVFGGMGYTWEVPVHRHLRAVRTLAAQSGAGDQLDAVARDLLATGMANGEELKRAG